MSSNTDRIYRRSTVFRVVPDLDRAALDSWEKTELWTYRGPEGKYRLFSFADMLEFAIVLRLMNAGVKAHRAWDMVKNVSTVFRAGVQTIYLVAAEDEIRSESGPGYWWTVFDDWQLVLDFLKKQSRITCILVKAHYVVRELSARLELLLREQEQQQCEDDNS